MAAFGKTLATLVNSVLGKVGYAVVTRETVARRHRASLRGALEQLRGVGFAPRTVIDVGVAFGTPELYETFPAADHLLIEPLAEYTPFLEAITRQYPSARYLLAAASAASGEITLHVAPNLDASTTVFDPDRTDRAQDRKVRAVTLDEARAEFGLQGPYLIKADVEGAELDVLRGAESLLPETESIVLETALYEFRPNSPQIADVIAFLRERGFAVYDITGAQYRPLDSALAQVDITFVRDDSRFRESHASASQAQTEAARRAFGQVYERNRRSVSPR